MEMNSVAHGLQFFVLKIHLSSNISRFHLLLPAVLQVYHISSTVKSDVSNEQLDLGQRSDPGMRNK